MYSDLNRLNIIYSIFLYAECEKQAQTRSNSAQVIRNDFHQENPTQAPSLSGKTLAPMSISANYDMSLGFIYLTFKQRTNTFQDDASPLSVLIADMILNPIPRSKSLSIILVMNCQRPSPWSRSR